MTEQEYRNHSGINYSLLADIDKDPLAVGKEQEETLALTIGSAVDCILTKPNEFNQKFTVQESRVDAIGSIVKDCYEYLTFKYDSLGVLSDYKKVVENLINDSGWQTNWKFETRVNKVLEEGFLYFESLKIAGNKAILSPSDMDTVNSVVRSLKHGEFTKWLFEKQPDYVEILKQKAIVWDYEGTECKSLLDFIYINHNIKVIIPIDLKTTGKSVYEFENSFLYWRYYLQASFYQKAVIQWAKENYPDYRVENFRFVVAERICKHDPLQFKISDDLLSAGEFGGYIKDKKIRGFKDLIMDYKWHNSTNIWTTKAEYYMTNGIIELDGAVSFSVF